MLGDALVPLSQRRESGTSRDRNAALRTYTVMRPLDPVSSKQRATYGFAFFVLFATLWAWATFGGYVSKTFLANPLTMLQEGFELLTKHGFLFDIGMTIWRVCGGFVLAAIISVPPGRLMGSSKPLAAFRQ